MGKEKLTDKQTQILEYIRHEILAKGYPPSIREICQAVDLKSTSSVHAQLSSLEAKGYIRRDLTKSRSIEIIDDDFSLTKRELVNIPIVGTVSCGQPILAEQNIEDYFPVPPEYIQQLSRHRSHIHHYGHVSKQKLSLLRPSDSSPTLAKKQ